ncbi:MAG: ggt [Myxococcales bacterium]|nr:ggt [Myxococcales bacterium]
MKRFRLVTAVAAGSTLLVTIALAPTVDAAFPAPLWVPRHSRGIAAAANLDASRAAAEILKKGGNAVDGAVAAALALGVVDPESSGLGGGGFAVVWNAKDKQARVLDFRETAPAKASRDMFLVDNKADGAKSRWGGLAVAVPGEPAGLAELEAKYGKLGLAAAAQPAIRLAKLGFAAGTHFACAADDHAPGCSPSTNPPPALAPDDPLRALLLPGGTAVAERALVRRPELARTLETLAHRGPAGFYQGAVGQAIVSAVQARGGLLTLDDLRGYKPIWREPRTGSYRGHQLWGAPAPAGGLTAIEALQILDARPPLGALGHGSSAADHVIIEAFKHAFADRARSLGDPAFVPVPEARLGAAEYARELASRISDDKIGKPESYGDKSLVPADPPHDHGTSHLCVADGDGNVVALTTTVNLILGARMVGGSSGVVLNDQMDDFSAQPGVPNAFGLIGAFANAIAAGKRPLSSMTPMIVTKDGEPILCVGAAGGPTIITATVQTIINTIDFGLDVEAAVASPRVHAQWMPYVAIVERETPRDVIQGLERRGHKVVVAKDHLATVQAIGISPVRLTAASDPRYGGAPAAP